MKQMKLYGWLLGVNLWISAFTFGGGYVVIPMIRKYYVYQKNLMTEEELAEMAAVAQSMPGAIAVNLAVLAGYHTAGTAGAIISCAVSLFPPILILSVISVFYQAFRSNGVVGAALKGMEAGVAALMLDLIVDMYQMILKKRSWFFSLLAPLAFVLNFFVGLPAIWVLVGGSLLCLTQVRRQP